MLEYHVAECIALNVATMMLHTDAFHQSLESFATQYPIDKPQLPMHCYFIYSNMYHNCITSFHIVCLYMDLHGPIVLYYHSSLSKFRSKVQQGDT